MAFPVPHDFTTTETNFATNHVVDLPATIYTGDLLLIFRVSYNFDGTPSGWTELGSEGPTRLYGRIADGSEGSTVTFAHTEDVSGVSRAFAISGVNGGLTAGTDYDINTSGVFPQGTPVSLTATWGSADNLFFAFAGRQFNLSTISSYPYADNQYTNAYDTVYDVTASHCSDEIASATSNPGAGSYEFTTDNSTQVQHIVIRPGSSGGAGATNYEYETSGGVELGGTFAVENTYEKETSGGVALGGTFAVENTNEKETSGGIALGGSFEAIFNHVRTMSGGIALGGSFPVANDISKETSGGIALGGTFAVENTNEKETSGGIALGGSFPVHENKVFGTSGGIKLGGTFPVVLPEYAPQSPIEGHIFINGAWVDIRSRGILTRNPVTITNGRTAWSGEVQTGNADFTLSNDDGAFSPDYQAGEFHGSYKRSNQTRLGRTGGQPYFQPEQNQGDDTISIASDPSLQITGDIDLRVELEVVDDPAYAGGNYLLASHGNFNATDGGWLWLLVPQPELTIHGLFLLWYDSTGTLKTAGEFIPNWVLYERAALRTTVDVSAFDVQFYTSDSIDGSWTQLDDGFAPGGSTSFKAQVGPLALADSPAANGWGIQQNARFYKFQMFNGIDGTAVVDADFTESTPGDATFEDDTGNTWTVGDDGNLSDTIWRFHGELASLPVRWNLKGNHLYAPVTAAGMFRRLRQGAKPLRSVARRAIERTSPVAYWPFEEQNTANRTVTRLGAIVGGPAIISGDIELSSGAQFPSSEALPVTSETSSARFFVPDYNHIDGWSIRWLMYIPSTDGPPETDFLRINAADHYWVLRYYTNGNLGVDGYLNDGTSFESQVIGFDANDKAFRMEFNAFEDGSDLDWQLLGQEVGSVDIAGVSDTVTSQNSSPLKSFTIAPNVNFEGVTLGHFAVHNSQQVDDPADNLNAYSGEYAAERIIRLCDEEGIKHRIVGEPSDTELMGPQKNQTFMDLLQECADTDLGILFEPRDTIAVGYRTASYIRSSSEDLELDYSAAEIAGIPSLDRDDNSFANYTIVTNQGGASAEAELTEGVLSTSEPPEGAGLYDSSYEVSLHNDERVTHHAFTRLQLQSVNLPRVSDLEINLGTEGLRSAPLLIRQILGLRLGDIVKIIGWPTYAYTGDLLQVLQGTTETIGDTIHTIKLNGTPGEPWIFLSPDEAAAGYDTAGSELASAASTNDTGLSVATTDGQLWTTDSGDLPFDIWVDGVRVTVSAISGSSSPQTFTVTGVVRDIPAGSEVRLWSPTYYTL